MTIHNGFVQARKTSPATRTYFLHRNKYNEPSDLSWGQNNSTSEKMIKCFVTFTPNPRGEKMVHELAGLLTDSRPDAFPTLSFAASGHSDGFRTLIGASQQRDCPGFAPDSLLLSFRECEMTNQFCDKDRKLLKFFTNFFVAFCVVCFAMFWFLDCYLEGCCLIATKLFRVVSCLLSKGL